MGQAIILDTLLLASRRRAPARTPDFRKILGESAWANLPGAVKRRFSVAAQRAPHVYRGAMDVEASCLGLILAGICRLIGTPLAPFTGEATPVEVRVRADGHGGIVWDRTYNFAGHAPLLVTSRKVMDRAGLMEVVQGGVGMKLELSVEDGALHFRSRRYVLAIGALRIPLPFLLTPGEAHVVHAEEGAGRFRFTLSFSHPWFGRLFHQTGLFKDSPAEEARS